MVKKNRSLMHQKQKQNHPNTEQKYLQIKTEALSIILKSRNFILFFMDENFYLWQITNHCWLFWAKKNMAAKVGYYSFFTYQHYPVQAHNNAWKCRHPVKASYFSRQAGWTTLQFNTRVGLDTFSTVRAASFGDSRHCRNHKIRCNFISSLLFHAG